MKRPIRLLTVVTLLVVVEFPAVPAAASAACADCGTVSGSISVFRTAIRSEGPKHERDVVVFLDRVDGPRPEACGAEAAMDQRGLVFLPHVLAIQRGTTVTFLNSDNEQHNVYFLDDRTGDTLDIGTWGPGVSVEHRFEDPGTVITLCKLHLEMAAFVVVVDGPWYTTAEIDGATLTGRYEIGDVPAGEYELTAWHKKLKQKGGPVRVSVRANEATTLDLVITKAEYARETE